MLVRVEIHDFALIEKTVFEPETGLVIISGETGAGKSILIDAIGSLLGGRLSKDMIRFGQDKASVEALFIGIEKYLPAELLAEIDPDQTDELILAREVNLRGRSLCRINGRMASLSLFREVSGFLLDIHGQNDQQAIFKNQTQLELLDRYGASKVAKAIDAWQKQRSKCIDLQKQLQQLGSDPAERARQLDLLKFQIDEIEEAALEADEEAKLLKRMKTLGSLERVQEGLDGALDLLLADSDQSVPVLLSQACESLIFPAKHIEQVKNCYDELVAMLEEIADHSFDLREVKDKYQTSPEELEQIQERLDLISKLKRKYGQNIPEILKFYEQAKQSYDYLSAGEENFKKIRTELDLELVQLLAVAEHLHNCRKKTAVLLEEGILSQLKELGMKNVNIDIELTYLQPTEDSLLTKECNKVNFLISPNPGEPLKPLAKIASGGEASRIMLALKTILAAADNIPLLIFDEIDSGISGKVASMVGAKLLEISKHRQVMCITHMAQIAALAQQHFLIEKQTDGSSTHTNLIALNQEGRLSELARLLSGGIADLKARELAEQLLTHGHV